MNLREERPFDMEDSPSATKNSDAALDYLSREETNQMWKLGLTSVLSPKRTLELLYEILVSCGVEWKVITEYHLQCRPVQQEGKAVKFTVQLFKVKNKLFLLDFKKISGNICAFFELFSTLRGKFRLLCSQEDSNK